MPIFNATLSGGTVYATTSNDTVNGSAANDTLHGLGGTDTINGNAGDDIIFGDGTITYAQAFNTAGYATSVYTGAQSTSGTGLTLTSIGVSGAQSVWRIRNATNTDQVVTFESASKGQGNNGGVSVTITIPAMSDAWLPSANLGTHKLFQNNKQIDVKASSSSPFSLTSSVSSIDGDDIINGGAGNDTIDGGGGNDTIRGGDDNDTITGGGGNDQVFGDAGDDTLLVSWSTTGDKYDGGTGVDTFRADVAGLDTFKQEIDLVTGRNNWGDTFVNVENLVGTKVADKLFGSAIDNAFWGGNGNDQLDGRGGNDRLYGEAGDDQLIGGSGDDLLDGGDGDDRLIGGAGADRFVGGAGVDTADYSSSTAGVTINLANGANAGDAAGDTFDSIELIVATQFDDVLTGDATANNFAAGAGNDVIFGSGGGDTIDGGADFDTINYSNATTGVTVNLATGSGAGGDALSSIEGVVGSSFADILTGGANANVLRAGAGNDLVYGSGGGDTIDGGADNDTVDYSNSNAAVVVSLATGLGFGGHAEGDHLSDIENLTGSKFADILTGNADNNTLNGGSGDDRLIGGAGADALIGGAGVDAADYSSSTAGVTINLANGANAGDAAGDTFDSIELIIASQFNDILTGDSAANNFAAGAGNDVVYGSGGGDTIDGGADIDVVDYSASTAGVAVNLVTGLGSGGFAQDDKLKNIENLVGSNFADVLTGDAKANVLQAGAGNDIVFGSGGGDTIDGGADNDTVDYTNSNAAVIANLLTGIGSGGFAEGDRLSDIENLTGSKFADILTGNADNNTLNGGSGDDRLIGGAGADALIGGAGVDTADYSSASAAVTINLLSGVNAGDAAGDTFDSIEAIIASQFNDTLTGDATANRFYAGSGNDIVYGSGGGDIIDGGGDVDLIDYSGSNAGVSVDLSTGKGIGGWAQGDVISNVENLNGSQFDDLLSGDASNNVFNGGLGADRLNGGDGADELNGNDDNDALFGDAGVDTLSGGLGNDRLTGGAGADVINGNDGVDTADYRHSDTGVDVSLTRGNGLFGDAEGDTLQFIENLSGSAFADVLTGDNGANRLTGMSGEDRLYGMGGNDYIATGGGYDYVDGGDGIDTVTYEDSWDRVVVNLTTGKNQYGEASRDVLVNVENIIGSVYDDTITGDAGANRLTGGDGNDVLSGMGGIDYIYGGNGNDRMTGGTEADVFVFNAGFGNDTITDFWAGAGRTDRIWLQGAGATNQASPAWSVVDSSAGAVITIVDHGTITLTGVTVVQLHLDDFIFT